MLLRDIPEDFQEFLAPYFDESSNQALVNLLPADMCGGLLGLLMKDIGLVSRLHDEADLFKYIEQEYGYHATAHDTRIRYLFWQEFENSQLEGRRMIVNNIHSLVCSPDNFRALFMRTPPKAAMLICKPATYNVAVRDALNHGLKHMRRILDMEEYDKKGKLIPGVLNLKIKIYSLLDLRVHGAPKQSIQQLNVNVDASKETPKAEEIKKLVQKGDVDTIRRRIHEIEQKQRALETTGDSARALEAEVVLVPKAKKK